MTETDRTNVAVRIEIDIAAQRLILRRDALIAARYPVSTARNGPGEEMDSECTPRGCHVVGEKIGADAPAGTVFVGRRPTGEVYAPELRAAFPDRDWILTRILWLTGLEAGVNQGGRVDTRARFIYIHGSPDDVPMGVPGSRGCIRMRNRDVIALFDQVEVGTPVMIA